MRYFNQIVHVTLTNEILHKAKLFSETVVGTTNYTDSNQHFYNKILDDHYISKLGEEAVKTVLQKFGTVTGPDYKIYPANQKSWKEDLFFESKGISVKTQKRSAALRYGLSWTFQCGPRRRDQILQQPDAWIAFVEYDDVQAVRFNVYPLFQIKELTFGDPLLPHLRGHKKVVYATSLFLQNR